MKQYQDLIRRVLDGDKRPQRAKIGGEPETVLAVFGERVEFDLDKGFPLQTTKRIFWRGVVAELLWFLSGSTSVRPLQKQGVKIWDAWADERGEVGPIYGAQWRGLGAEGDPDQVRALVHGLRSDPFSRRHLLTAWQPRDLHKMVLPPCHVLAQFYVSHGRLSCQVYQRSADLFVGVPFNVASYALLVHLLCACVPGLAPGRLLFSYGDLHLYGAHLAAAGEVLAREPRPLPRVSVAGRFDWPWEIGAGSITLEGYDPHEAIYVPVAV